MGYFGATFGRPVADPPHWLVDGTWDTDPVVDMLATADESREDVVAETARHAGHADILREGFDGAAGLRGPGDNLPTDDAAWWSAHVARVEAAAREA